MKTSLINENLLIYPCSGGIKLVRPSRTTIQTLGKLTRIGDLNTYAFSALFVNRKGICEYQNEVASKAFDVDLIYNIIPFTCAIPITIEESLMTSSGTKSFLNIKLPWYNQRTEIIGYFICSILLGEQPLGDSIHQVAQMGILNFKAESTLELNKWTSSKLVSQAGLTLREVEMVKYITGGKTAKKIAEITGLSRRTVEHYLENIKIKLKVSKKCELIEKVLSMI